MAAADPPPLGGFGITVSFTADRAVVGVRGEVDLVTAPEFAAVLDAVIGRGYISVVLDLDQLVFMDVQGLRAIASGVGRLETVGGTLTLRSAPTLVLRILDITGLTDLLSFENPLPAVDRLGSEQSTSEPGLPVRVDVAHLGQHLRRVTSIPADDDVIDGALRLVVALARATVSGADGVSVSLQRHGRLTTVAASDQTVSEMDAYQYATGEGPCVDASIEGRWFHSKSLEQETRWPAFTPKAHLLGINAILSHPLLTEERPLGALNIYSRTAAAFSGKEQELASVFATETSTILRDAAAAFSEEQVFGRIKEALEVRQVIAHAQGVLMERRRISEEQAYAALIAVSRQHRRPMIEAASDIVSSSSLYSPPTGVLDVGPSDD